MLFLLGVKIMMQFKRNYLSVLFLFLLYENLYSSDSFKEFKDINTSSFASYSEAVEKDFEKYQEELKKAFDDYKRKIAGVWGEKNALVSDQKTYVSYFSELRERSLIDFEKGIVKLEIILPENEYDEKFSKNKFRSLIAKAVSQRPDIRSITDMAKNPDTIENLTSDLVLRDQIKDKNGNIVNEKNAYLFASQVLEQKKLESKAVKGESGEDRVLITIDFPLADDHIKKRALKYVDIVIPHSKKRGIDHELVFALIETESCFNPFAKSPIPAFGLMQLVPATAGRDAFKLVYKKDRAPTDKFLYDPENNILLGSAYLYILFNRYLDEIENIESRKWCVIAAYNTGIGNVFETFAGKYKKNLYPGRQLWKLTAFERINSMSPDDVYNFLCKNLKYKETRNYIKKVRSRIPNYTTEHIKK